MEDYQNENFLSSEFVNQRYGQNINQGSIKRYADFSDNMPMNANVRKQITNSNNINNVNNYTNTITQNQPPIQETTVKKENTNPFLEKPVEPERLISHFYGSDFLTDAILKADDIELPFHKVVLSAASDFLYKYFALNKDAKAEDNKKVIVKLPEIMKSIYSRGNIKECLEKILKYCYYNQDIKSIESDIIQNNCFTLLELSHCLGIKSLNKNLEKLIIKHFLKMII